MKIKLNICVNSYDIQIMPIIILIIKSIHVILIKYFEKNHDSREKISKTRNNIHKSCIYVEI
jgi:hypothetical protein